MQSFVKKLSFLVLFVSTTVVSAQEKTIRFTGTAFTYPIIEKWIQEYEKEQTGNNTRFEISTDKNKDDSFQIVAYQIKNEESDNQQTIFYVGRYALIPITSQENPYLNQLKKGLNSKDLKDLVFEKSLEDIDDFSDKPRKEKHPFIVYTRDNKAGTTIALAEYFEKNPEDIKGKKIIGDDIFLLSAIKKYVNELTFSSLNYAYDIKTRQLKQDISIVPLKIKSQQQAILNSGNVDKTISLLEDTHIETIPIEKFGFVVPKKYENDKDFIDFIN
ncbi:MAG: substrate-binding domain-containing protein [Tannerellaceae bacterium]|jgi:ABC-type phosphate transport system substrate-binding protein|nr:substrate-binding domain-containing protein [Tannerellaceae bacterium]